MNGWEGCMRAVLRVIAGILVVVFMLTMPVTLLAHNAASVLFSPAAMARVLSSQLIDSGLLRNYIIDQLLTSGEPASGTPSFSGATAYLTPDQKDAIAQQLLPDSWAKDQITALSNGLYAWLDSRDPSPNLSIDMQPVRERLTRGSGPIVQVIVDSWPACSLADLVRLAGAVFGSEGFPYCQPPEPLHSAVVRAATQVVQGMAAVLPESLSLNAVTNVIDPVKAEQTKAQLRLVRFVMRWAWVIPLALLGLIMALAVRSWKGLALWWGVPLLSGGLLTLVPVLLGPGLTRQYLQQWAAGTGMPAIFTDTVKSVGSGLMSAMLQPQLAQGMAISIFAALMLLVGLLLKRRPAGVATSTSIADAQALRPPAAPTAAPRSPEPNPKDRPSGMFG